MRNARDGETLVAGTVLVAPSGWHLIVTSPTTVGLIESDGAPPRFRLSADLLPSTLAVSCGERAIAVARCGGRILAQDEASSERFDMPGSAIRTQLADQVLPLSEMAGALCAMVDKMAALPSR